MNCDDKQLDRRNLDGGKQTENDEDGKRAKYKKKKLNVQTLEYKNLIIKF